MVAALGASVAYGMMLLLPLYVVRLGGDEAGFGVVLSSAALPAIVVLVLLVRYPQAVPPHRLLSGAVAVLGAGALGAALVTGRWEMLVGVGILIGTAWACVYTVAPMVVSAMVTDAGRSTYFGYLTGSQQLGIGLGPVLGATLIDTGVDIRGTFLVAGVLCALSALACLGIGSLTTLQARPATPVGSAGELGMAQSVRALWRSQARVWLGVIALFACLFTAMTQFQATFAAAQGLPYSIFFIGYTAAVIAVRFGVAPRVSRFDTTLVIAVSVSVMALAVASFLLIGGSPFLYAVSSVLLGMGYGLALPAVQAEAVNVSPERLRPRVLPLAGLVFQAGILLFPLVVGLTVTALGYWMLFLVLLSFAVLQATLAWRQVLRPAAAATPPMEAAERM